MAFKPEPNIKLSQVPTV